MRFTHAGATGVYDERVTARRLRGSASKQASRLTLGQLWAVVAVAVPGVASLGAPLSAIDLAYQIRVGNDTLAGGLVSHDAMTFTASGRQWLDQQWGAQALLAGLHRLAAWPGLALGRAALISVIFLAVFLGCRATGLTRRKTALLTLASFAVATSGLGLRPQLFGLALAAVSAWLVADRRRRPRLLLLVPVLVAAWANLHGTFFVGPLLLGLAWLEGLRARTPRASRTLVVAAVATAASLLNPFGVRVWSYVVTLSTNPEIAQGIEEWRPPTVRTVPGALFFASLLGVGAVLAVQKRPTPWPTLLGIGTFVVIALYAIRGVSLWAIVVPTLIAPLLADDAEAEPAERRSPAHAMAAVAVLGLGAVLFARWIGGNDIAPPGGLISDAPQGVTAAMARVLEPRERVFNEQTWGSWFEFALPDNPVFSDARIELFPPRVWSDYLSVSQGREGWEAVLDGWEVDVVAVDRMHQAGLVPLLRESPLWRLVYEGSDGLVFSRA